MISLATLAVAGCLAVSGPADQILARDLAAALPGFTAPAPDATISLAPAPGVQRVFHVSELRRIALRLQWNVEMGSDICFERRVAPPDAAQLLYAMQQILPDADIQIVEYSRQAIPQGEIEFPLAGLRPSGENALWTGYVRFGGNRRFTLWARVKVQVSVTRVIAVADLKVGQRMTAEQLRVETRRELPNSGHFPLSVEEAITQTPRVAVRAGVALRTEMLEMPRDVMRGDIVTVDVRSGAAHLELEAKAESSGSAGQTIVVLNLESHKRFAARVEGKGRVSAGMPAPKVNP